MTLLKEQNASPVEVLTTWSTKAPKAHIILHYLTTNKMQELKWKNILKFFFNFQAESHHVTLHDSI